MSEGVLDVLVCYDVETATEAGERRLRRVARLCKQFGPRVQDSVFELRLKPSSLERLRSRMLREMDVELDSVRIYRLRGPRSEWLEILGVDHGYDPDLLVFV